jgi:hypothetical protein
MVGRIEWDPESEARLPLVVIDGKAFSWEEVGHMLMTFEGSRSKRASRTPSSLSETCPHSESAGLAILPASPVRGSRSMFCSKLDQQTLEL